MGAIYLGVDVQSVAYTALSQAQVLDKVPEDWRPKAPADKSVTREQLVNTLREELGMLRTEITALRSGQTVAAGGRHRDAGFRSGIQAADERAHARLLDTTK